MRKICRLSIPRRFSGAGAGLPGTAHWMALVAAPTSGRCAQTLMGIVTTHSDKRAMPAVVGVPVLEPELCGAQASAPRNWTSGINEVADDSCLQQGDEHVEKILSFGIARIALKDEAGTGGARHRHACRVVINVADDVFHCPGEGNYIAILNRNGEWWTKKLTATETMVSDDQASARQRL